MAMSDQRRAHAAVRSAIVTGDLKPLRRQRCRDCGERAASYHHHKGYAPDHWLTVMPLCGPCHGRRHSQAASPPGEFVVSTVRTPDDIGDALTALAKAERRSVNATMVIAFERYIRQMEARRPKSVTDER